MDIYDDPNDFMTAVRNEPRNVGPRDMDDLRGIGLILTSTLRDWRQIVRAWREDMEQQGRTDPEHEEYEFFALMEDTHARAMRCLHDCLLMNGVLQQFASMTPATNERWHKTCEPKWNDEMWAASAKVHGWVDRFLRYLDEVRDHKIDPSYAGDDQDMWKATPQEEEMEAMEALIRILTPPYRRDKHSRWEDALFELTTQRRFLETDIGKRYIQAMDDSMGATANFASDRSAELFGGGFLMTTIKACLEQADPVYVNNFVTEIVATAMEEFDPEPVLPTDPFTATGFALFPRRVEVEDAGGPIPMGIRAIAWMPIRLEKDEGMEAGGQFILFFTDGDAPGPHGEPVAEGFGPLARLHLVHAFFIPYNQRMENLVVDSNSTTEAEARRMAAAQWKLVQVLWRIGSQVVRAKQRAPRAARREARRYRMPQEDITIITLRKMSDRALDSGDADWEDGEHYHVQFVVRGHWRNQWYPSEQRHRQIWINPYVKGPEHAPMRMTQRVFELVR